VLAIMKGDDTISEEVLSKILETVPDRLHKKIRLAFKNNTRVILAKNPETHRILDIVKQYDKARRILNGFQGQQAFSAKKTAEAIDRFNTMAKQFELAVKDLCAVAGVQYITPSSSIPIPQATGGNHLVESMKAVESDWHIRNVYKAALGFMMIVEYIEPLVKNLPDEKKVFVLNTIENLKSAVTEAALV